MTREESAKWAALLQAQADGKRLEHVASDGVWRESRVVSPDVYGNPDHWRIAPDLPPKPSQEWLDRNGVELTGECRQWRDGELFYSSCGIIEEAVGDCLDAPGDWNRWILRRRAPQVRPWTIDTVPMPLVVKDNYGVLFVVNRADESGLTIGSVRYSYKELATSKDITQRDNSPCGEVVK